MLNTIFITASKGQECKNFEHILRIRFLSKNTNFKLLCQKNAQFSQYIKEKNKIIRSFLPGKLGYILFGILWITFKNYNTKNVVIITEPSILIFLGFLGKILRGYKWVVDVWDIPLRYVGRNKLYAMRIKLMRMVAKKLFKYADLFVLGVRPDMEFRYYEVPKEKILFLPTTIRLEKGENIKLRKYNNKKQFDLLCMRTRHRRDMGLDILSEVYLRLINKIPNLRLWLIGNIDNDAISQIKSIKELKNVHITGLIEHSLVMRLIKLADICIIPWRESLDLSQTYPTKVMEYITEGKVVVACRLKGIAEMIRDEYNGILFTPGNSNELEDKLWHLYRNVELRKKISLNAKKYNKKFDSRVKNAIILKTLENL